MKCIGKVKQEKRKDIHAAFWKIENRDERMAWIEGRIQRKEVEVRRKPKKGASTKDRNGTRIYRFTVDTKDVRVHKHFFLRNLGDKYDTIPTKLFKAMTPSKIKPKPDGRGKNAPKHTLDNSTLAKIDEHNDSFYPSVSHYRREHAPLRLCLS